MWQLSWMTTIYGSIKTTELLMENMLILILRIVNKIKLLHLRSHNSYQ